MKKLFNLAIVIALSVLSVCAFNTAWDKIGTLFTLMFLVLPMISLATMIIMSKKISWGLLPLLPLLMIVDKGSDSCDVFVAAILLVGIVLFSPLILDWD